MCGTVVRVQRTTERRTDRKEDSEVKGTDRKEAMQDRGRQKQDSGLEDRRQEGARKGQKEGRGPAMLSGPSLMPGGRRHRIHFAEQSWGSEGTNDLLRLLAGRTGAL